MNNQRLPLIIADDLNGLLAKLYFLAEMIGSNLKIERDDNGEPNIGDR